MFIWMWRQITDSLQRKRLPWDSPRPAVFFKKQEINICYINHWDCIVLVIAALLSLVWFIQRAFRTWTELFTLPGEKAELIRTSWLSPLDKYKIVLSFNTHFETNKQTKDRFTIQTWVFYFFLNNQHGKFLELRLKLFNFFHSNLPNKKCLHLPLKMIYNHS